MDKVTFFKYGKTFQEKLVSAILMDKLFFKQIFEILKVEYFDDESLQKIVRIIQSYFVKYDDIPSIDVFKVEIKDIQDDMLKESIVEHLKAIYRLKNSTDLDYVKEQALGFCKNQELKNAIMESVDFLEREDYDSIQSRIDAAMKAGSELNVGHEYFADVDSRYEQAKRDVVQTPWPIINDVMDGGLGPGETAAIMAPSGAGKTWWLCAIGAHALKLGKNVIHYTLELNEDYVGLRYDALMTGYDVSDLKYHKDSVKETLKQYGENGGQLVIKYYSQLSATHVTLSAHIERCMLKGIKPDLIIVDYADNMHSVMKYEKDHLRLQYVYIELAGLCGRYGVPLWTATQSNRESIEKEVIFADSVAGSYGKIMETFFSMSISRKTEDKLSNTARAHIVKNRFGPDGMTYGCRFNAKNGAIEIFDDNTVEGKQLKDEMRDDNQLKRLALGRFKELTEEEKKEKTDLG